MPSGRTHDEIALVTGAFLTPISFGLLFDANPGRAALFVGSYLVSGLLFSDDLDTSSIEYRRWRLLRFIWLPYQKLMPHRSWLSHGPLIGPLLRILYFAAVCTIALWAALTALSRVVPLDAGGIVGSLLSALARSISDHPEWWALAFLGFVLGSLAHITADNVWSWLRRRLRVPAAEATGGFTHHGKPVSDETGSEMSL